MPTETIAAWGCWACGSAPISSAARSKSRARPARARPCSCAFLPDRRQKEAAVHLAVSGFPDGDARRRAPNALPAQRVDFGLEVRDAPERHREQIFMAFEHQVDLRQVFQRLAITRGGRYRLASR